MAASAQLRDHQDLLQTRLRELLARGWRGYSQHGRGAVLIDDRSDYPDDVGWRLRPITLRYYSNREAVASNSGWPNKQVRLLVRDYNPNRQAVCVFLLAGGLCAGYKIWDPELTPAQAAAREPAPDAGG